MRAYKEKEKIVRHIISSPFIYAMIVPFIFFDICLEMYHRICFALYGLPYVPRTHYIKIDRQKLSYLNGLQKLNCVYCGYGNGLMHYASTIAAQTEQYWCGIQHQADKTFRAPVHHDTAFLPYGDEDAYRAFMKK